jgi:glycosyltransferase involved in cell wall biosynthesis
MIKKLIVIDARLYGPHHTGIGRYTKNLIKALTQLPDFNAYRWTLLVYPQLLNKIRSDLKNTFTYIPITLRHYTLAEQLFLPILLYRLKPHLVHFTNFNKPLLYFGTSVVTFHDLIKHFSRGPSTTTLASPLYWIKYLGYLTVTSLTIKLNRLIVPSNYWRDYIISHFHKKPADITTTHEAVDSHFLPLYKSHTTPKSYLIYTGNLYPHKNIKVIFQALRSLSQLQLKIISGQNTFWDRTQRLAQNLGIEKQVEFLGFIDDHQYKSIYSQALALVHPALIEGFALTGLEAMALNCPVIASNTTCIPEIYGQAALYFNPQKPRELIRQITKLSLSPKLRQSLIKLGQRQVKKYSWSSTANKTFSVYQQLL